MYGATFGLLHKLYTHVMAPELGRAQGSEHIHEQWDPVNLALNLSLEWKIR